MSFLGKNTKWKRILAHLLVWGMVITGMPGVPMQVQAETQTEVPAETTVEVQSDVAVASVEGVSVSAGSEDVTIVGIDAEVNKTVFAYEVESLYPWAVLSEVTFTMSDGRTIVCEPWDNAWNELEYSGGLKFGVFNEGGEVPKDWLYNYSVGEFTFKVYVEGTGVCYELPIRIVELDDLAYELPVGETIFDLSGAEIYDDTFSYIHKDGYWLKMELEPGNYRVEKTAEGVTEIIDRIGYTPMCSVCAAKTGFHAQEEGTYYAYVKGREDFDVTLTKMDDATDIVDISADISRTTFWYGVIDPDYIGEVVNRVYFTLADGTVMSCWPGNDTWFACGLEAGVYDAEGNIAQWDGDFRYPIGKYVFKIYAAGSGACLEIPIEVKAVNAYNIELGEKVSGLAGSENWEKPEADGGHWLKVEIPETADYIITKDSEGGMVYVDEEGFSYSYNGDWVKTSFYLSEGTYYLYIMGKKEFSVTMAKMLGVETITPVVRKSIFYYGVEEPALSDVVERLDITLGDGTVISCEYGDELWGKYDINGQLYTTEGRLAQKGENGLYPVGRYFYSLAFNMTFTQCRIPVEICLSGEKDVEAQLENAVDEILKEADALDAEDLSQATEEEKKNVVTEFLDEIARIYEEQDIAQIGAAAAEKAEELVSKLADVEKRIEELLNTAVTVKTQDIEAEKLDFGIKNALLSVPAGQNAQVRVANVEVPEHSQIKKGQAAAVKVELVTEQEETKQLQAPVLITMKLPDNIREDEEIAVYHYHDESNTPAEKIPVSLKGNRMISFATGSFSTFVIANEDNSGVTLSGTVTSYGDIADATTVALVDANGNVVAETTADAENGSYEMANVAVGDYTLAVSKESHVTKEITLSVTENTVQDAKICLIGDVSGDGKLNALDQKKLYNHIAKKTPLTEYDFAVGDVNEDGKINALDQKIVYNHIAKKKLLW